MPAGHYLHDDFYAYNLHPRYSNSSNPKQIGSFDVPAGLVLSLF